MSLTSTTLAPGFGGSCQFLPTMFPNGPDAWAGTLTLHCEWTPEDPSLPTRHFAIVLTFFHDFWEGSVSEQRLIEPSGDLELAGHPPTPPLTDPSMRYLYWGTEAGGNQVGLNWYVGPVPLQTGALPTTDDPYRFTIDLWDDVLNGWVGEVSFDLNEQLGPLPFGSSGTMVFYFLSATNFLEGPTEFNEYLVEQGGMRFWTNLVGTQETNPLPLGAI